MLTFANEFCSLIQLSKTATESDKPKASNLDNKRQGSTLAASIFYVQSISDWFPPILPLYV